MSINTAIIDQQLGGICQRIESRCAAELKIKGNPEKLKSVAFVFFCVKKILDIEEDAAFDCLTEGGGDLGVDAIHISDEIDSEFIVTLFQGKYKKDLTGNNAFPENAIVRTINTVRCIFDPGADAVIANERMRVRIEEVRSLIRDGFIPKVRIIACNNGIKWDGAAQKLIDREQFGPQVTWEHVNHDSLVKIMQNQIPVDTTLHTSGKSIVEDINYYRVCVGRMPLSEVVELMHNFGERLLDRNIRRYLGVSRNRVNNDIQQTIMGGHPDDFYFLNNGITLVCEKMDYNELQKSDNIIQVKNLQIINGGQTCMTVYETLSAPSQMSFFKENDTAKNAMILFRLYQLPSDANPDDLVSKITYATNSQNPVDLRDLKANDEIQKKLEFSIRDLGFNYRRKRSDTPYAQTDITIGTAAEAILAVCLKKPHQAKFFAREHFGKLYGDIFNDTLNGAQVIISVLLYRIAENHRRRPDKDDYLFTRYASCFISMQMGSIMLKAADIGSFTQVNHDNFTRLMKIVEENGECFYRQAMEEVNTALGKLYGDSIGNISLQQLSATFRRGDLLEYL